MLTTTVKTHFKAKKPVLNEKKKEFGRCQNFLKHVSVINKHSGFTNNTYMVLNYRERELHMITHNWTTKTFLFTFYTFSTIDIQQITPFLFRLECTFRLKCAQINY